MAETKAQQKARIQALSTIDLLREVIDPAFHYPEEKNYFSIKEDHANQPIGKVWKGDRNDIFGIDIDKDRNGKVDKTFPFLNTGVKQLTKKCDLIVFVPLSEKRLLVLLFEMKSFNLNEYLLQLKAGREFVQFMVNLLQLYFDVSIEVEFRGVLMRYPTAKGTTQPKIDAPVFEERNTLLVCDCDRQTLVMLPQLIKAASK